MRNIGFYVNNAIKTILITIFVNFVNKYTQIQETRRMMNYGLAAMNVIVG